MRGSPSREPSDPPDRRDFVVIGERVPVATREKWLLFAIVVCAFALRAWYASHELNQKRFWDERYGLENVSSYLASGSLAPVKVYYPSPLTFQPAAALLKASESLHARTGWEHFQTRSPDGLTRTSYALARLTSVVYGTLSVVVLFGIGRLAFGSGRGTEVGLASATALAFLPTHIRASCYFKPDALVVLGVLLAFYWSLAAVEEFRPVAYLKAAFGIALALSAKMTGGVVALVLVVGSLAVGWKDRRRWGLLLLAALASLILFFAINPYGHRYPQFASHLKEDYARRAAVEEMTPAQMPMRIVGSFVGQGKHGPWFGGLVAIGGLGLLLRTVRSRRGGEQRAFYLMLLTFPAAFSVTYAAVTPYFKSNNFLPVTPFTCLFGAWAAVQGWKRLRQQVPSGGRRVFDFAAIGVFLMVAVLPGLAFVYQSLTPTTFDRAEELIHGERPDEPRRYHYEEGWERSDFEWERPRSTAKRGSGVVTERLASDAKTTLRRADGAVFLQSRLGGEEEAFYRDLLEPSGRGSVHYLQPSLFEMRGPALVVVSHPWSARGPSVLLVKEPCSARSTDCWRLRLPETDSPRIASLLVKLPKRSGRESGVLQVEVGEESIRSWSPEEKPWQRLTERFRLRGREIRVSGPALGKLSANEFEVHLQEWRRAP